MIQYDDLPEELVKLFGNSYIPEVLRDVLRIGWGNMSPDERHHLLGKLRYVRQEPKELNRIVVAVNAITRTLLSRPPNAEEIQF